MDFPDEAGKFSTKDMIDKINAEEVKSVEISENLLTVTLMEYFKNAFKIL